LAGTSEGKRPVRRPRHTWEYNIKVDMKETGLEGLYGISLAQDRDWWWALVNMVMKLQVP
jgi:hypothetical protein